MSRRIVALALVVIVAAGVSTAGEKAAWYDMENCAMCKNMSMELIGSMSWDQYTISNGIVAVTTVNEKYLDAYRTASVGMQETGMKMHHGEKMDLCGSCTALNACMMKGAMPEYVETKSGSIMLITSDSKEVVAELHGWVERNKKEMAKYSTEG